jgi:hypothetical protein
VYRHFENFVLNWLIDGDNSIFIDSDVVDVVVEEICCGFLRDISVPLLIKFELFVIGSSIADEYD